MLYFVSKRCLTFEIRIAGFFGHVVLKSRFAGSRWGKRLIDFEYPVKCSLYTPTTVSKEIDQTRQVTEERSYWKIQSHFHRPMAVAKTEQRSISS